MTYARSSPRRLAIVPRLRAARLLRAHTGAPPSVLRPDENAREGLSVVMAAHNEQDTLEDCLAHLGGLAQEIVVVDAASDDRTAEIAARFGATVIETSNKPMLEINKNIAMDAASCRWVLVLDPDERLSSTLRQQIENVVARDDLRFAGYWTPRRNYILGRWMRTMGMYPGFQLRLVRRSAGRFSEREHHLPMSVDGPVGCLTGDLIHLSDHTVSEIVRKRTRYAEFAASQMHARGERFRPYRLLSEPIRTFARQYLLLGGWLEGVRGLIYAALSAYGAMLRQARLWELQKDPRRARSDDSWGS
jgi:glycosyltransferase involved in cell wall biosynthesis